MKSQQGRRRAPPDLWEKLKPLARQKRHEPTRAEEHLWEQLRGRKLAGAKFRRQHAIERFIVDFYCHDASLIIEVDGEFHDYTVDEDALRQAWLEAQGLRVVRFQNDEVIGSVEDVLARISAHLPTS